jgi:hypothetical protein
MLTYQWTDKTFAVDSLNARRPVSAEDELIVICCPDPFGAEECQRTVRQVAEQDEKAGVMDRPIVLFNQRLSRWVVLGNGRDMLSGVVTCKCCAGPAAVRTAGVLSSASRESVSQQQKTLHLHSRSGPLQSSTQ